jgi:hypothetical protein
MWTYGHAVALRLALDLRYAGVIEECSAAIAAVRGRPPSRQLRGGSYPGSGRESYVILTSYGVVWLCLFPQHGPGRKHQRPIQLEQWQQRIVDNHTGLFLRGLIHTDGWRGLNRVRVKGRDYAYPRYQFSNRSDDIRRLFTDACDRLGVAWRPWGRYHISVARRGAVARLDEFVGPKR